MLPNCNHLCRIRRRDIWFAAIRLGLNEIIESFAGFSLAHPFQEQNAHGDELIADGDMEAEDTSAWTDGNDAALTKETAEPYEGLQSLRIERDGTNDPYAAQTILVIGKRYLVNAIAKSDGSAIPRVLDTGVLLVTGTADTFYQEFDLEFTATTTEIRFESQTSSGTEFTEWDAISVVELIPEGGGSVVHATNPERLLGRGLLVEDFTAGLWVTAGVAAIDDLDSFTTTGVGGVRANDPSIAAAKTYTARIKGTSTSSVIQILSFSGATTYKAIGASGAFDESFTFTGVSDGIYIRANNAGTTNIDWDNSFIKQTGIDVSDAYPKAELLTDAGAAASWTDGNSADLSDQAGGVVRIARNGAVNNPYAFQPVVTIGDRIKVSIEIRTDGNAIIRIADGIVQLATATGTTDFQLFELEYVATATNLLIQAITNTGTEFIEMRLASERIANPLNGASTGTLIGQTGAGDISYMYELDGVAFVDTTGAEHNGILDPETFGKGIFFVRPTWDTTERFLFIDYVDADNYMAIRFTTNAGEIAYDYKAEGQALITITYATGSPIELSFASYQVQDNIFQAFFNGWQVGVDTAVPITILGNYTAQIVGTGTILPTGGFVGKLAYPIEYSNALSQSKWKAISDAGGV